MLWRTVKIIASIPLMMFALTSLNVVNASTSHFSADPLSPDIPVVPGINWYTPSDGTYPVLTDNMDIWIDASLSTQRIHIMNGDKTLYTMITSSGLDGPDSYTPQGTYRIQNRGIWFYAPKFREGAEFWVSWEGWGRYLFHSVPMDEKQEVIPSEAAELGKKASHGCFRLTIPDAKWIYEHIPQGTKVVIHE